MTIEEIRKHSIVRGIFKELARLNLSFTFEPTPKDGGRKATGLFRVSKLPYDALIRIYFEKDTPPIVLLNGIDISERSIRELKGLIDEAVTATSAKAVEPRAQLSKVRFIGKDSLGYKNGEVYELIIEMSVHTGYITIQRTDRSGKCIYGSMAAFLKNWSIEVSENKSPVEEPKDTAELKYARDQDVKWLPSGKVCTFIQYLDARGGHCEILAYGTSHGPVAAKIKDIEPWYRSAKTFKANERIKSVRSGKTGTYVGPIDLRGRTWVLFDDDSVPVRVDFKYLEKLPEEKTPEPASPTHLGEEKKLPDWVKGDILRLRGTDKQFTFSEFNVSGDKAIVERDSIRSWQRINDLELYTAKRSEPENGAQAERKNDGKLEWSLVDFPALEPMVLGLMAGARKYSPGNWKKGLKTSKIMESLMRHYVALSSGELIDEETGVPHIGLLMCNAMFLSWILKNKPELNDL